jgi:hypothetical protein
MPTFRPWTALSPALPRAFPLLIEPGAGLSGVSPALSTTAATQM